MPFIAKIRAKLGLKPKEESEIPVADLEYAELYKNSCEFHGITDQPTWLGLYDAQRKAIRLCAELQKLGYKF